MPPTEMSQRDRMLAKLKERTGFTFSSGSTKTTPSNQQSEQKQPSDQPTQTENSLGVRAAQTVAAAPVGMIRGLVRSYNVLPPLGLDVSLEKAEAASSLIPNLVGQAFGWGWQKLKGGPTAPINVKATYKDILKEAEGFDSTIRKHAPSSEEATELAANLIGLYSIGKLAVKSLAKYGPVVAEKVGAGLVKGAEKAKEIGNMRIFGKKPVPKPFEPTSPKSPMSERMYQSVADSIQDAGEAMGLPEETVKLVLEQPDEIAQVGKLTGRKLPAEKFEQVVGEFEDGIQQYKQGMYDGYGKAIEKAKQQRDASGTLEPIRDVIPNKRNKVIVDILEEEGIVRNKRWDSARADKKVANGQYSQKLMDRMKSDVTTSGEATLEEARDGLKFYDKYSKWDSTGKITEEGKVASRRIRSAYADDIEVAYPILRDANKIYKAQAEVLDGVTDWMPGLKGNKSDYAQTKAIQNKLSFLISKTSDLDVAGNAVLDAYLDGNIMMTDLIDGLKTRLSAKLLFNGNDLNITYTTRGTPVAREGVMGIINKTKFETGRRFLRALENGKTNEIFENTNDMLHLALPRGFTRSLPKYRFNYGEASTTIPGGLGIRRALKNKEEIKDKTSKAVGVARKTTGKGLISVGRVIGGKEK